jgi:hypothetical protein
MCQRIIHCDGGPPQRVPVWLTEAALRRSQASQQCTAEINKRLVAQRIYRWTLRDLPDEIDGIVARPIAGVSPVTIDQLLAYGLPPLSGVDRGDH